jgi:transcriptional regulator with XRE-family HTH domain
MKSISDIFPFLFDNLRLSPQNSIMSAGNDVRIRSFSAAVNRACGAKLRRARRSRDVSQGELAAQLHLSRVTVGAIEGGKQNIQLSQIFLIARALDRPVEELVPTLAEVEQLIKREAASAMNPIAASGALFLEDARALLLQMKRNLYEREAPDETADRTDGS